MSDSVISAVVLTARAPIRDAVRAALKDSGLVDDNISYPEKAKDCLAKLKERKGGILVVDWEFGVGDVIEILVMTKESQQQDTVAIFLVAATMSDKIISAGHEFGVSQIHTGDITKDKVTLTIKKLLEEVRTISPIKQHLRDVADARFKGNWAQATSILEPLVLKDPGNARLGLELAENYIYEKKWDNALELIEEQIGKNGPDSRSLHLLGKCYLKLGKKEEAINTFKEAKVINPFNIDRLMELGNALLQLDRAKEAEDNFDDVINISPKNAAAKKGKGTCMLMDGEVNEALSLLKDNITGNELASVFNTAAVLSMRNGRIPAGMGLYDAAVQALNSQDTVLARLYYNKGIGYFKWKKKDEAKECFEKAIELDPSFENAAHNLSALSGTKKTEKTAEAPKAKLSQIGFSEGASNDVDNLEDEDERI